METSSGDFSLSDAIDQYGEIEIAIAQAFGNWSDASMTRTDAVEVVSHLIRVFEIGCEEVRA